MMIRFTTSCRRATTYEGNAGSEKPTAPLQKFCGKVIAAQQRSNEVEERNNLGQGPLPLGDGAPVQRCLGFLAKWAILHFYMAP